MSYDYDLHKLKVKRHIISRKEALESMTPEERVAYSRARAKAQVERAERQQSERPEKPHKPAKVRRHRVGKRLRDQLNNTPVTEEFSKEFRDALITKGRISGVKPSGLDDKKKIKKTRAGINNSRLRRQKVDDITHHKNFVDNILSRYEEVNATGPAIAGIGNDVTDPPVKKKRLRKIFRRNAPF